MSRIPSLGTAAVLVLLTSPAVAQQGNWQTPGPIQVPKGTWQTPGEFQKPGGLQEPAEVRQPVQAPKPARAKKPIVWVRVQAKACETRVSVLGDALFEFDSAELTTEAATTLASLGPQLSAGRANPATIEGHTDAVGSEAYNEALSRRRAEAVRDWLAQHGHVDGGAAVVGYGEARPVAPNEAADGTDNPEGRRQNRRVEILLATCG